MAEQIQRNSIQTDLFNKPNHKSIAEGDLKRDALYKKYSDRLSINPALSRKLVSFQDNKNSPFYRWFRYKEAFSSRLVSYLLELYKHDHGSISTILDPFAGIGTTLTTAAEKGWKATGIEILPVGIAALRSRLMGYRVDVDNLKKYLNRVKSISFESPDSCSYRFPHVRITRGAFTEGSEGAISAYVDFLDSIEDSDVRHLLWFACLSILEDVSYTRKDGQYLRWDYRSGRSIKSNFDKGDVLDFGQALKSKLEMMLDDIEHRRGTLTNEDVEIIEGTCLSELPKIPDNTFDLIITSPPYANRYDYTRTYALELAFMGKNEQDIKDLRQTILSCTVENRSKIEKLEIEYARRGQKGHFQSSVEVFERQEALHEVLDILNEAKKKGLLNNNNIPNLVKNYHFEMNLVIREFERVLKPGGNVFMVNDNVSYMGEEVPVDLILSDFASDSGLTVNHIWYLTRGKGNSSQQMGEHGRTEMRKCVYNWSKPL